MRFEDWGLIDYKEAEEKQHLYVNEVASESREETVIICTHPAVVTTGRATEDSDVFAWDGPIYQISRGGRATYHGPNQLVTYPILQLSKSRQNLKSKDIHSYLRSLEQVLVNTFQAVGIESFPQGTGVWWKEKKLASIGIAVKKWVTYHGIAINLFKDEKAFQGINPCGLQTSEMTSVEEVIGQRLERTQLQLILQEAFRKQFS